MPHLGVQNDGPVLRVDLPDVRRKVAEGLDAVRHQRLLVLRAKPRALPPLPLRVLVRAKELVVHGLAVRAFGRPKREAGVSWGRGPRVRTALREIGFHSGSSPALQRGNHLAVLVDAREVEEGGLLSVRKRNPRARDVVERGGGDQNHRSRRNHVHQSVASPGALVVPELGLSVRQAAAHTLQDAWLPCLVRGAGRGPSGGFGRRGRGRRQTGRRRGDGYPRWTHPRHQGGQCRRGGPSRQHTLPLSLSPAGGARFGTPGARSTSAASPPPAISSSTPSASLLARGRAPSGRLGCGGSDRLRGASLTDRRHFLGLITSRKGPAIDILIFSGISCAHECTGILIEWNDFT